MISKEKLLNGYIENDNGELRKLWVDAASYYGFGDSLLGFSTPSACRYCFIIEGNIGSGGDGYIIGKNKLTIEDFVDVSNIYQSESITTSEDLESLRKSDDIFQQMLDITEKHQLFIQFDGFDSTHNSDKLVITKQGSDVEYVVTNKQEFDKLVESFKVLEKFERK